jgi:transcriptional regulator with XRE-family HTH domain
VWTLELGVVERLFASALIRLRAPLRGIELKYLRKVLGLSLAALGEQLGVSDVTVLNWERAEEKRLDLATEVAMRAFFAERLGVVLEGTPTALRGADAAPEIPVELPAAS